MKINKAWLKKLGVTASEEESKQLVEMANAEWEWRVGNILIDKVSTEELSKFQSTEDEAKRLAWLEKAIPDYKDTVREKYDEMVAEVKGADDKVAVIKNWPHNQR